MNCIKLLAATSAVALVAVSASAAPVDGSLPVTLSFFTQSPDGNIDLNSDSVGESTGRFDFGNTEAGGTGSAFPVTTTIADLASGIDLFLPGSTVVNQAFNFSLDLVANTFTYSTPVVDGATGPQTPGGSIGALLNFQDEDFIGFTLSFAPNVKIAAFDTDGANVATNFTFGSAPTFDAAGLAARAGGFAGGGSGSLDPVDPTLVGGSFLSFNTVEAFADAQGGTLTFDLELTQVPVPAPLALLVAGLAGLGFVARRKA